MVFIAHMVVAVRGCRVDDLDFVGVPNPLLLLAPSDEYTSLPVAQLQRSGGDHKLIPGFVPPCLRIGAFGATRSTSLSWS